MSDFINQFISWSHGQLFDSDQAQEFLLRRGSSENQWRHHSIGYIGEIFHPLPESDSGHTELCEDEEKKLNWCETCRFNHWSSGWDDKTGARLIGSRILNSVVYPLTSYSGSCIGFQIRSLGEKKYDTFVQKKRPEASFFGTAFHISKIWSRNVVFLVEGPSDLLTLERFTDYPVLALTTNSTNENQTRFLSRFVDRVVLFLDLDKAGREGCENIKNKLPDKIINVVDYKYPNIALKDVNDLWCHLKDEKFSKHVQGLVSRL